MAQKDRIATVAHGQVHLAKAKEFIAKGEDFYRKAAEEIKAAMDEDSTLSHREIGERIGKSKDFVRRLVQSYTSGSLTSEGIVDWENDSQPVRDERAARKVARDNPEALVEAIEAAPPQARAKIRKALDIKLEKRIEHSERAQMEREAKDPQRAKIKRLGAVLDVEKDLAEASVLLARSLELSFLPHQEDFSETDREEFAKELQEIIDLANGYRTIITTGDVTLADDVLAFADRGEG